MVVTALACSVYLTICMLAHFPIVQLDYATSKTLSPKTPLGGLRPTLDLLALLALTTLAFPPFMLTLGIISEYMLSFTISQIIIMSTM